MTSDAMARRAALDPRRSFIVQAPAGSGKTELLTQRYLRCCSRPSNRPSRFWRSRSRARPRRKCARAFCKRSQSADAPAPESPHKRSTWELARAVREADARAAGSLMQHPARLRIQTIDALNASLARRLPVLAGRARRSSRRRPSPLYEWPVARLTRAPR